MNHRLTTTEETGRIETDSLGPMRVPRTAAYGAQTARAVENFEISGWRFTRPFIEALGLIKIANDIRHLGAGPRCGLGELILPETQPGSSIMPGKVNPVMCETVLQVGAQVIGQDAAITWGAAGGNFELNTMLPVIAHNLLASITLLTHACRAFTGRCVLGLEPNRERCRAQVEQSLALATALTPEIGYDRAAQLAKQAHQSGRTIREVAEASGDFDPATLDKLLDPARLTSP